MQGVVGRWLIVGNKALWDIFLWCGEAPCFFRSSACENAKLEFAYEIMSSI